MNEALQHWLEDFTRESDTAFDRLVRGVVPLGGASQLSFGEIINALFEPGDAVLDTAAMSWLEKRILGPVPENTSLHRWVSVLEEYFRGIATMELPQTGEILRHHHKRIRLWLHGFYEGPDRDPEGAFLMALALAQDDHRFSPLWRRLILGEELAGRPYLSIGILGFRKMPGQDSAESPGVPDGLLQALVELADKPGTGQAKWKQTMRSLFAIYRRSESYWIEHLAPLLPHYLQQSNSREWLSAVLPGIPFWRPLTAVNAVSRRRVIPVPTIVSQDWAIRIRENPSLCDTPAFSVFLAHHRNYARTTGEVGYISKSFNNLATSILRADSTRTGLSLSLIEEALLWAPGNPHNWTSYAIVLCAMNRFGEAITVLWEARYRFPWNVVIRNELPRILRDRGDLITAEVLYRETRSLFPSSVFCRTALADLLIELGEFGEAETIYREALEIDKNNQFARGGLARVISIIGATRNDEKLRDEAKSILQKLADEGNYDARYRLRDFEDHWERAKTDPNVTFRRDTSDHKPQIHQVQNSRAITEMSVAERLGRAMISLWQAERAEDASQRSSLCANATALLDVPEDQIDGELLAAFVETRGLVLLALGDARKALSYFEEQIHHYGRGGWIGIQLGDHRARIALCVPKDADDNFEVPSSQSARFALYVARVIQALVSTPQESEVRDLLKTLYPRAADFATRAQRDTEGGLSIESGAEMLGSFLQTRWFRPSGIQTTEDLDRPDALHAVVERVKSTRTDTFDVISSAASDSLPTV